MKFICSHNKKALMMKRHEGKTWKIQRYCILDNPSQKPEILFFEKTLDREDGGGNVRLIYDMKAYGNRLYFTTIEDSETAFYTIDLTNPASQLRKVPGEIGEDGTQPYYIAPSDGALLSAMTNVERRKIFQV